MKSLAFSLCILLLFMFVPETTFAHHDYGLLDHVIPNDISEGTARVTNPANLTDGRIDTVSDLIYGTGMAIAQFVLDKAYDIEEIELKFYNVVSRESFLIVFYDISGNVIEELYAMDYDSNVFSSTRDSTKTRVDIKNVKEIRLSKDGRDGKKAAVYEFNVKGKGVQDRTPPNNVSNLRVTDTTSDSVSIDYTFPIDVDFSHVNIYRDDVFLTSTDESRFTDQNLQSNTEYKYTVKSVDFSGNESDGVSITATTNPPPPPPEPPGNLKGAGGDKQAFLEWDASTSLNISGYNVYQDGTKINNTLIPATSYMVAGLENYKTYQFEVTAVNSQGVESQKSTAVFVTPSEKPQPPKNIDYTDGSDSQGKYILIEWEEAQNAASYEIYVDGALVHTAPSGTNQYLHYVTVEKSYYRIEIVTVDLAGNKSDPGRNPSRFQKAVRGNTPSALEAVKSTLEFIALFGNLVLLALALIFSPFIVRFVYLVPKIAKKLNIKP